MTIHPALIPAWRALLDGGRDWSVEKTYEYVKTLRKLNELLVGFDAPRERALGASR